MWSAMKQQLEADLKNFQKGKSVSLLAKWIKTADSKKYGDEKTRHSDGAETRLSGLQLQKNRPFSAEIYRCAGSENVRKKVGGDRLPGGLRKSHDDLQERISKT